MRVKKRSLYRDPVRGKIAGICAGLGDYFNVDAWLVRVVVAAAIILTGVIGLPLLAYVIAYFVLDSKPLPRRDGFAEEPTSWQTCATPQQAFERIEQQYAQVEQRLRRLEHYVASPAFDLKRKVNRL